MATCLCATAVVQGSQIFLVKPVGRDASPQCFIQAFAPGGGRGGVWGGADEPLPSMGSGAKPQKIFLSHFPGGPTVRPGGFAPPPRANA
jgi:hypothetical protein